MSSPGSDVQEVLQQHWPTLDTEIFQYICGTSAGHIHSRFRVKISHVSGIIFPYNAPPKFIYEHECCIWVLYLAMPVVITRGSHLVLACRGNDQDDSRHKHNDFLDQSINQDLSNHNQ